MDLERLLARQQQQQQDQQVSLEAAIAFIQDCDFDSGDEDHEHDQGEGSLVRLLQQRSHLAAAAAEASSGFIGRQQQEATGHHAWSQQQQPPQVHPQQGAYPLFTGAASFRTFGLQTQDEGAGFPSAHGLRSGASEDEQAAVNSTTITRASGSGSAKRGMPSGATATATKGKQGASSSMSSAASLLRDMELDKRFRGRRKDELLYLREKMKEFQTQLDQLKKAARSRSATQLTGSGGGSPGTQREGEEAMEESSEDTHVPSMWGVLATRQREERRKVEEDNVKLKSAVERQIRMAKSLEKILRKRTSASIRPTTKPALLQSPPHKSVLLQSQAPASKRLKQTTSDSSVASDDVDVHEMLDMDELYRGFDYSVFYTLQRENGGPADPAVPILEANVKCGNVNDIYVESLNT